MRVGVIGTGFASTHIEWIHSGPKWQITELAYARRSDRAVELARRYGIERIITDGSELAGSDDLDVVVVASPPETHEHFALAAIERGRIVVCEKPLAHTATAAQRLSAAATGHGVRTMVCFQWRENEAFGLLRKHIDDGSAGDLVGLELSFHHDFLAGPATAWPWRHQVATAGAGALGDLGVHLFDLLTWITSLDWTVIGTRIRMPWRERIADGKSVAGETDDFALVDLEDGTGSVIAQICTSRASPGFRRISVTAVCTRATLRATADPSDGSAYFERLGAGALQCEFPPSSMNPYIRLATDLATNAHTVPNFADGLHAQRLLATATVLN